MTILARSNGRIWRYDHKWFLFLYLNIYFYFQNVYGQQWVYIVFKENFDFKYCSQEGVTDTRLTFLPETL